MFIDEEEVFAAALEIADQADRADYLAAACGEFVGLRLRIEKLITAHHRRDGLLDNESGFFTSEIDCCQLSPGTEIGHYTIAETLGEGGFGVVYRAEQRQPLRRDVAVKIIKPGVESQQIVKRFETELQTLGRMEHPHIAQVFDAGSTDDGQPFFAMELVHGTPITEYCRQHKLTVDQRLRLFLSVCRAIQHAHEKGVIHRDIKPSNVLVTQKDGEPFPKIIDFGIATVVAESDEYESSQAHWIGTPAYMSPEEIESGNEQIGVRTDVYGLGLLLFELLTDRNPHWNENEKGVSISEIRRRIVDQAVQPPSKLAERAQLHGDLDCIALKCLDRMPGRRYDSALNLARDIERFRNHETVSAHPSNATYRLRKFARRNRASLIMWAAAIAVVAAILVPTLVSRHHRAVTRLRTNAAYRYEIEESLAEAGRLHEQALVTGSSDLESIRLAIAAARNAQSLLRIGSHDEELHARVNGYVSRLVVEERERQFFSQIDRARIHFADPDPAGQQPTRDLLAKAFRAIDIDVKSTPPNVAAKLIASRSEELRGYAVASLDIWAVLYCQDAPETRAWLRSVVNIADQDRWRSELRSALDTGDVTVLNRLANSDELEDQSTSSLILLVNALQRTGSREFIPTLQRAADAYPNVLFFNMVLGDYYSRRAQRNDAEATQKAVHYLSAALALRPNDYRILSNLSMNLSRLGNHSRAVNLLRRAVDSEEDFWIGWHNLGLTYARKGDYLSAFDAHATGLLHIDAVRDDQPIEPLLRRSVSALRLAAQMSQYQSAFVNQVWEYSDTEPANWPAFSDRAGSDNVKWKFGRGGFGTRFFHPVTPWATANLWLQKRFKLTINQDAVILIRAVGRVEIHVDSRHIVTRDFAQDDPRVISLPRLVPGEHQLSIRASSMGPERYVLATVMIGDQSAVNSQLCDTLNAVIEHFVEAMSQDPAKPERQQQIVRHLERLLPL